MTIDERLSITEVTCEPFDAATEQVVRALPLHHPKDTETTPSEALIAGVAHDRFARHLEHGVIETCRPMVGRGPYEEHEPVEPLTVALEGVECGPAPDEPSIRRERNGLDDRDHGTVDGLSELVQRRFVRRWIDLKINGH